MRLYESISFKPGTTIVVNDKMQKLYKYELVAPVGKKFAAGFKPFYTPKQMLKMGVFEGHYMTDCRNEFPASWFSGAKLNAGSADETLNYFEVKSRRPLSEWKSNGWIVEEHDPRGWFQWYCRYYLGRRIDGYDARQIKRWKSFKRHASQVQKACDNGDIECRPRQRQALLQWSYDCMI